MPDFSEFFEKSKAQPVEWNGKIVMLSDKFPVANGDILFISIEKANIDFRQGLCIDITGSCECDGKLHKIGKGVRMLFWKDTAPKEIKLKVFTKENFVRVYNIWEDIDHRGSKSVDYGRFGAAMIVEEIENGRRYKCVSGKRAHIQGKDSFF